MIKPIFRFFIILSFCFNVASAVGQVVNIPDPNLRAAVENALGKASGALITVADMATLTGFDARNANIVNLTGLEYAINLTRLNLLDNSISDISSMAGLTSLTSLGLGSNNISDVSALSQLTNLTALGLEGNSVTDISPLAELTNLINLNLGYNGISNISAVAGLINLTYLYLAGNSISDISPLAANTGLGNGDTVNVRDNPLSYLSLAIDTHIPLLQSRGVTVEFDDRTHLNVGEPNTVRLIYFLPSDRQPKPDIDADMDALIKTVQQSYADDMEHHGFGRKTFAFETDATGQAVVHHVAGQFTAEHYEQETLGKVHGELEAQFDTSKNIYLVVVDSGYLIDGFPGIASGLVAIINNLGDLANYVYLASHELRHTFGLAHDFSRDGRGFTFEISECTAEFLDVHRYFNARQHSQKVSYTTFEMLPPNLAAPPNAIRFRFEITGAAGLHQARLHTPYFEDGRAGGFLACKRLTGTSSTVEFVTTELTLKTEFVYLQVIDVHGNISWSEWYPIDVTSLLSPPEVVLIPDANLSEAVREALELAPDDTLTTHTMLGLRKLAAQNRQVTDLTGLEHAHHLKWLNLGTEYVRAENRLINSNSVSDLSPLADLTNLTYLNLQLNPILDISAVSGLTNLTELWLMDNPISDLSPVSGLTNLTTLRLWSSSVSDISAVASLINLKKLDLADNRSISDISAVSGLTNLTWLGVQGSDISDISAVSDLTNLKRLFLNGNRSISDISAVSGLTNLEVLNLWNNRVSDISAVSGLTNLIHLDLDSNTISDISAVSGLINLTDLFLSYNTISDVSALSGLTQVTLLNLASNTISDVSALSGLTQLNWLYLRDNDISDLSPLVSNTGLRSGDTVNVQSNPLSYQSIHTHIPSLQSRRVEVQFDNVVPLLKGDVNGDGVVNIQDLVLAARRLGQRGQNDADMNGDGVVNIQDLVLVAGAFGNTAAPSALDPQVLTSLTAADIRGWLTEAEQLGLTTSAHRRGIAVLEQLLSALTPKETTLLPNYPNPFNPETWIPYHLANAADVTLTVYDISGVMVRQLELGYQPAGYYTNRSKAAYWDGRNQFGESVASGVYFSTLTVRSPDSIGTGETRADKFTTTRQMLILK